MHFISFFVQLNYQRDQIAAIKDKQKGESELPQEKPFSAAATETSRPHSTLAGMTGGPRGEPRFNQVIQE